MLTSFHIENFRIFRRLILPRLGHVNLVVGRNNTGKTVLLEALRLHAARGSTAVLKEILLDRDEFDRVPRISKQPMPRTLRLESLFHRRRAEENGTAICLGPLDTPNSKLLIKPVRLSWRPAERPGSGDWQLYTPDPAGSPPGVELAHVLGLAISYGGASERLMPPESVPDFFIPIPTFIPEADIREEASAFVPAAGLSAGAISTWWDTVTLTDAEERVAECLRIVAPVQRISLVERPGVEGRRMVMVKLEGESDPVPLRSLGDGVRKMFSFALGLEGARESRMLLIDEIENGIHYSAHENMWRFIIAAAQRSGVQVVATTHSWDCVMGFQSALASHPDLEASAIRLYRGAQDVEAALLDRAEIAVATRDQIDFR